MTLKKSSSVDSFGPFLERLQERQREPGSGTGGMTSVLATLSKEGPVEISALLTKAGLRFDEFTEMLDAARKAGLVQVVQEAGSVERVSLTPEGELVAKHAS
jgi:predicted transcriptional regulator